MVVLMVYLQYKALWHDQAGVKLDSILYTSVEHIFCGTATPIKFLSIHLGPSSSLELAFKPSLQPTTPTYSN